MRQHQLSILHSQDKPVDSLEQICADGFEIFPLDSSADILVLHKALDVNRQLPKIGQYNHFKNIVVLFLHYLYLRYSIFPLLMIL